MLNLNMKESSWNVWKNWEKCRCLRSVERENTLEDKERLIKPFTARLKALLQRLQQDCIFTKELLEKAKEKGVKLAYVTLHVGIGTSRPVKAEKIEEHHMHFEEYFVDEKAANIINETILAGGRIVSVGTTSTRTLESAAQFDEECGKYLVQQGHGSTGICIYPGYEFKIINALITNFHLPKSTLLMLISALYNREDILRVL